MSPLSLATKILNHAVQVAVVNKKKGRHGSYMSSQEKYRLH